MTGEMSLWYYGFMKELYHHSRSVRNLIVNMNQRNIIEQRNTSLCEIKRQHRIRLTQQYPDLSTDEIEAKIERIVRRGSRPTEDTVPISPGIPVDVLAARRKARKAEVKKRKRSRR